MCVSQCEKDQMSVCVFMCALSVYVYMCISCVFAFVPMYVPAFVRVLPCAVHTCVRARVSVIACFGTLCFLLSSVLFCIVFAFEFLLFCMLSWIENYFLDGSVEKSLLHLHCSNSLEHTSKGQDFLSQRLPLY